MGTDKSVMIAEGKGKVEVEEGVGENKWWWKNKQEYTGK